MSAPMTSTLECAPALDQLRAHLKGINETGAGGGEVESPGALRAELVLHQAGGGGEEHVRRDGGDDDGLDFAGLDAAFGEAAFGGFDGHVAGGHALLYQVALADADAAVDPFVGGLDHFFEIVVGEQAGWNVGSQSADLGAS